MAQLCFFFVHIYLASLQRQPFARTFLFAFAGRSEDYPPYPSPARGDSIRLWFFLVLQKSFKLVNARLRNQVKAGSFGAGGLVPGLVLDAEKQLSRWKVSERGR